MKILLATLLLITATTLPAQSVVISDFNTLPNGTGGQGSWKFGIIDQFTVNSGVLTVGPVSGGSPDNSGYFAFADVVGGNFSATGLALLSITARLDSGNAAPGFIINLFDNLGTGALTATFSASSFNSVSFTTASTIVSLHPNGGNIGNIQSFGIAGTGTTAAFRISFDSASLAAVPEPATSAALAGLGALGFAVWRKRRAGRSEIKRGNTQTFS